MAARMGELTLSDDRLRTTFASWREVAEVAATGTVASDVDYSGVVNRLQELRSSIAMRKLVSTDAAATMFSRVRAALKQSNQDMANAEDLAALVLEVNELDKNDTFTTTNGCAMMSIKMSTKTWLGVYNQAKQLKAVASSKFKERESEALNVIDGMVLCACKELFMGQCSQCYP